MKIKGEYSTSLFVADYLFETGDYDFDKDGAFEAACMSAFAAIDLATEELKDAGLKDFRVVGAEFVEFDSYNIGHAFAHYHVDVEGATTEQIKALFA